MTCCEADIQFYGFPCRLPEGMNLAREVWIRVQAALHYENTSSVKKQPVLSINKMELAEEPLDKIVYLI